MHVVSFLPNNSSYRRLFDAFPLELYRDEVYVDYNPFFITNAITEVKLFMVMEGERVLGRAAALIDPFFPYKKESVGLLGFFDTQESLEVVEFLIDAIERWLREQGCSYILGPVNCSLWFSFSFAEKLQEPFFTDRFNKEYYGELFTLMAFEEVANYSSTMLLMADVHADPRFTATKERFEKLGVTISEYDSQKMESDLSRVHSFLMDAFKKEPLYTPISFFEFKSLAGAVIPYLEKSFVLCAEHEGEIVGFVLAYPDLFCKEQRRIVLQIVAVKPGRSYGGLGVYLTKQLHYRAKALDYDAIIHAHMNDRAGVMNILDEHNRTLQRYTLYGRSLVSENNNSSEGEF